MQAKFATPSGIFSTCYNTRMITPAQCRAARALLDWSQQRLADESNIGNATIRNFEGEKSAPQHATLDVLCRCFESAGIEFLNVDRGDGVIRLRGAYK